MVVVLKFLLLKISCSIFHDFFIFLVAKNMSNPKLNSRPSESKVFNKMVTTNETCVVAKRSMQLKKSVEWLADPPTLQCTFIMQGSKYTFLFPDNEPQPITITKGILELKTKLYGFGLYDRNRRRMVRIVFPTSFLMPERSLRYRDKNYKLCATEINDS